MSAVMSDGQTSYIYVKDPKTGGKAVAVLEGVSRDQIVVEGANLLDNQVQLTI